MSKIDHLNFDEYKDVWIFAEHRDGKLLNVSLEILGEGYRLSRDLGGGSKVCAMLPCGRVEDLADELFAHGADEVYLMEDPVLEKYTTDGYAKVVTDAILEKKPEIVLFGATGNGRDLAPRVAARLSTGLTADCTRLDVRADSYAEYLKENSKLEPSEIEKLPGGDDLRQTLPAFGGNLMATILCTKTRPQMCTIRPGVMQKPERDPKRKGVPVVLEAKVGKDDLRVKVLDVVKEVKATESLSGADIVCAGGRGLGGPDGLNLLKELADAVGGVIGVSRGPIDLGWIDESYLIGQTGVTVKPKIYFACGISGAMQHAAGMQDADCIIAINKDADAPIFGIAHYAIVGDLHQIIPEIITRWK